jgi:hypothetical protein
MAMISVIGKKCGWLKPKWYTLASNNKKNNFFFDDKRQHIAHFVYL